jgi:chromosome partitioning protein
MLQAPIELPQLPHVVVVGNEKGGAGKTTLAMHVAIALAKAGQRVATIDLDSRQQSFTRYMENRRAWAARTRFPLVAPAHFLVSCAPAERLDESEAVAFAAFEKAITAAQTERDFLVIDTPPHDDFLMRLAHAMADTLITPLNDSFLDLDVLARLDPVTLAVTGISHYAQRVIELRACRRATEGAPIDWVVMRNRTAPAAMPASFVAEGLHQLALQIGFRDAEGLPERPIFRDLFPRGLTALDELEAIMPGFAPDLTCADARTDVQALLEALRLPLDERSRRRAAARAQWFAACGALFDGEDDDIIMPVSARAAGGEAMDDHVAPPPAL